MTSSEAVRTELRCPKRGCGKLIGIAQIIGSLVFESKCPRCGHAFTLSIDSNRPDKKHNQP